MTHSPQLLFYALAERDGLTLIFDPVSFTRVQRSGQETFGEAVVTAMRQGSINFFSRTSENTFKPQEFSISIQPPILIANGAEEAEISRTLDQISIDAVMNLKDKSDVQAVKAYADAKKLEEDFRRVLNEQIKHSFVSRRMHASEVARYVDSSSDNIVTSATNLRIQLESRHEILSTTRDANLPENLDKKYVPPEEVEDTTDSLRRLCSGLEVYAGHRRLNASRVINLNVLKSIEQNKGRLPPEYKASYENLCKTLGPSNTGRDFCIPPSLMVDRFSTVHLTLHPWIFGIMGRCGAAHIPFAYGGQVREALDSTQSGIEPFWLRLSIGVNNLSTAHKRSLARKGFLTEIARTFEASQSPTAPDGRTSHRPLQGNRL
jgi:hypothetical protein